MIDFLDTVTKLLNGKSPEQIIRDEIADLKSWNEYWRENANNSHIWSDQREYARTALARNERTIQRLSAKLQQPPTPAQPPASSGG